MVFRSAQLAENRAFAGALSFAFCSPSSSTLHSNDNDEIYYHIANGFVKSDFVRGWRAKRGCFSGGRLNREDALGARDRLERGLPQRSQSSQSRLLGGSPRGREAEKHNGEAQSRKAAQERRTPK